MPQVVKIVKTPAQEAQTGTGGLKCQMPGYAATISAIASTTGGIRPGGLIETDQGRNRS